MVRTVIIFIYVVLFLTTSIMCLVLYGLCRILGWEKGAKGLVSFLSRFFSRSLLTLAGAKVTVFGIEHIPVADTVCFVSNHQGIADILVISGFVQKVVGFIAKKELKRAPILNIWMLIINCIFIDRGNIRQAAQVIERGAEYIRRGYPMVVFPEGTRSRGPAMGRFKRGSIKLALRSDSLIVPLTVNGTYKLFEEYKSVTPSNVELVIHPPIDTGTLTAAERKELPATLHRIIEGGLHEISQ